MLRIPAQAVADLDTQKVTRIPAATTFSATFTSGPGSGIVVDRQVVAPPGSPAPQQGTTMGVPGGADRWLLPAPVAPLVGLASLAVVNLSGAVRSGCGPRCSPGADSSRCPESAHTRFVRGYRSFSRRAAGSVLGTVPVEIVASGPVAVEADALPAGSPGVSVLPALPLP